LAPGVFMADGLLTSPGADDVEPRDLARLLDLLAPGLTLFARQWCAVPEDVVQEAFVKLAAQRVQPDDVRGWLYRVVRNGAISAARAEQRRRRHEAEAAARRPEWFEPVPGLDLDGRTVTGALQALDLELREVLVAHLWGGLTFQQIAHLLGISDSTAHRRYLSGLALLRERLDRPCRTNTTPSKDSSGR
jgi:RNA polymerase sigma-70 factor (ECF subfamily)